MEKTLTLTSRGFLSFLTTQFLGALNDNIFKFLLIGYAMSSLSYEASRNYVPLAGACFILPYLLFSGIAGKLADRLPKRSVMIATKWLEVGVMLTGVLLCYMEMVWWLLAVLFVMGAQSTLFSPAKYGYLPEILDESRLSMGNGLLQLFTFIPIILGGGIGSYFAQYYRSEIWYGAVCCVCVAVVGVAFSYGIALTPVSPRNAQDAVSSHRWILLDLWNLPYLRFAIVGNTFFWLMAAVYQSNIPIVVKQELRGPETQMGYLQAAIALGIGLGNLLAGRLSKGRIAYHFVIPGGVIMGGLVVLCGCVSALLISSLTLAFLLGASTGFYQLPMLTCIQNECPADIRGAGLAACNILDSVSMLLAALLHWFLLNMCDLGGGGVLVVMGGLTLLFMIPLSRLLRRAQRGEC